MFLLWARTTFPHLINILSKRLWLKSERWVRADGSWSAFSHLDAAISLHLSLTNLLKWLIHLVWVLFSPYAPGQCLAGKIDFHPHHSCFAEWIMLSSRISLYFATFVLQQFPGPAAHKHPHAWCPSNVLSIQSPPPTHKKPHLWMLVEIGFPSSLSNWDLSEKEPRHHTMPSPLDI